MAISTRTITASRRNCSTISFMPGSFLRCTLLLEPYSWQVKGQLREGQAKLNCRGLRFPGGPDRLRAEHARHRHRVPGTTLEWYP